MASLKPRLIRAGGLRLQQAPIIATPALTRAAGRSGRQGLMALLPRTVLPLLLVTAARAPLRPVALRAPCPPRGAAYRAWWVARARMRACVGGPLLAPSAPAALCLPTHPVSCGGGGVTLRVSSFYR